MSCLCIGCHPSGRSGGPSPWCIRLVQDRGELRWGGPALGQCVLARHVLVRHRQSPVLRHTCEEEKERVDVGGQQRVPQSETELQEFFDLSMDLLCIVGFDGYFKRVNAALERGARLSEGRALLAVGLRRRSSGRRAAVARGAGAARGGTRSSSGTSPASFAPTAQRGGSVEHADDAGARRRVRRYTGHNRARARRRRAARGAAHARGKSRRAARVRQRAGRAAAGRQPGRSRDPSRGCVRRRGAGGWPRCSAWTPRT